MALAYFEEDCEKLLLNRVKPVLLARYDVKQLFVVIRGCI